MPDTQGPKAEPVAAAPAATSPVTPHPDEHPETINRNARNGMVLFVVYVAFYAGFMGLCAFDNQRMSRPALAGMNLAVVYGMGLIFAAFALALVYMALCRPIRQTAQA
jgi:uncharacterized membrane protein (DUF485 family)